MIKYTYCTQCKLELNLDGDYPKCSNCNIVYFRNSKPTAGILPIKDGKVLLTKRAIEPYKGSFDIIGGFLEDGEDPKSGAKREALEETGLVIEPKEILGIYIDQYGENGANTLNIHYIGRVINGKIKANEDAKSLHWVSIEDLVINEGFSNMKQAIRDLKFWFSINKSTE